MAPAVDARAARAALGGALVIAGAAGAAAHAAALYTPSLAGPPPALDALLALLTAAAAAEALFWRRPACAPVARGRAAWACRTGAPAAAAATSALAGVLFAVGYRLDAFAWCLALAAAFALVAASAGAAGAAPAPAPAPPVYSPLSSDAPEAFGINGAAADEAAAGPPDAAPCAVRAAGCCCAPAGSTRAGHALFIAHAALWGALVATSVGLLGGAATVAIGWRRFPPRGARYSVPAGGATVAMHAWCEGARGGALPTVFLDVGGGGHSSSDVYGLAAALAAGGRRVCSADPPGTGWTRLGAARPAELDAAPWALPLLAAMGEAPPFTLVGTMDGGAARIYAAALSAPDAVAALVPMQYGPPEFAMYADFKRLDAGAAAAYARSTLAGRLALCDLYRSLGVGWGLIGAFIPPAPPGYMGEWAEKNFLNLEHEGQWDSQCRLLAAQVRDPSLALAPDIWAANRSLAPHVRVLALANSPRDPCAGLAGDACAFQTFADAASTAFMRDMATMTRGSNFSDCAGACAGWLGDGTNTAWVVAQMAAWGV